MRLVSFTKAATLAAVLALASACGDSSGPKAGPPATVTIIGGNAQITPVVGVKLPLPLAVKVADAQGQAVAGATVTWAANAGTLHSPTSLTNRAGEATMEWTLGTLAGVQNATATVAGVAPTTFSERAVAGPLTQIILTRDTVRLLAPGDAFRLNVRPADKYGNLVLGGSVVESADTSVVTVSNFGSGATVIAVAPNSTTTLRVTAGALTKLATVIVLPPPCGANSVGQNLGVGEVFTLSGSAASEFCLQGMSTGAEFVAVPFFSDQSGSILRISLSAGSVGTTVSPTASSAVRSQLLAPRYARLLRRDDTFDTNLRERSRAELTSLMGIARMARQRTGAFSKSAAPVEVGALLQLNVNSSTGCTNPTIKTGRVTAITNRAIVVADTSNPSNGFSSADYQYFGEVFDTLIYPVDVQNFGEPSDIDGNQRVLLFFTRAVNELTPANQNFYVGGFFYGRDLFPRTTTDVGEGCLASNQAEMFYLLAPDPDGVINHNPRPTDFVKTVTLGTLAHEFQHIINSSRHLYVNGSSVYEDTFLDEGLAHVAEELAFYRASGFTPGQNLDASRIQLSQLAADAFPSFQLANIRRVREYLVNTLTNSPYANNDNLSTRGATWSFLRYAADRRGGAQNEMWFQLVNPSVVNQHGVANLTRVLGTDFPQWVRDWAVANFADDFTANVSSPFTHPSWNFRSVLDWAVGSPFPLATQQLDPTQITPVGIGDGSAAYLRFGVAAGTVGGARLTARGGTPPTGFQLSILRTR